MDDQIVRTGNSLNTQYYFFNFIRELRVHSLPQKGFYGIPCDSDTCINNHERYQQALAAVRPLIDEFQILGEYTAAL